MKENWERPAEFVFIDKPLAIKLLSPVFKNIKLADLKPLSGGLLNSNYQIRIQSDNGVTNTYLLRIYSGSSDFHSSAELCLKEKAILNLVKPKVPVPDCIFASSEANCINHAYMVQGWINGDNLREFLQQSLSSQL